MVVFIILYVLLLFDTVQLLCTDSSDNELIQTDFRKGLFKHILQSKLEKVLF